MKKPLSETEPLQLMISNRCKDIIQHRDQPQSMASPASIHHGPMTTRPTAASCNGARWKGGQERQRKTMNHTKKWRACEKGDFLCPRAVKVLCSIWGVAERLSRLRVALLLLWAFVFTPQKATASRTPVDSAWRFSHSRAVPLGMNGGNLVSLNLGLVTHSIDSLDHVESRLMGVMVARCWVNRAPR
jgi:hypothetical protein